MTENDWKWFCEEWGGIKEKGLSVIVDFSNNAGNELVGPCKEILLSEEPCGPRDEENNEIESQRPVVRTFPEVIQNVNCFELFVFVIMPWQILNCSGSQTLTTWRYMFERATIILLLQASCFYKLFAILQMSSMRDIFLVDTIYFNNSFQA